MFWGKLCGRQSNFCVCKKPKGGSGKAFLSCVWRYERNANDIKGNAVQAIWAQTELLFLLFDAVGGCELSQFYPK